MTQLRRYLAYGLVLAIVAGAAYVILTLMPQRSAGPGGPGGRFRAADGPIPVLATAARAADVPVYFDGVGTTRALNTVTVRAQVDGKLLSLQFKEGQDVQRGEVLAQIDPVLYQAALDQAVAKKAQDEAQLANARLDLDRYTRLANANAGNKQQADTQKALVAQFDALVKADQAAIDNAQATLGYTSITAPIAGRTGIRLVDAGNLVKASDTTGIVVITQVRPLSIIFTLPQQQLAKVNQGQAKSPLAVEALGSDNKTVIDRGVLQVVDNQVDQTTGTVRLKAEFPNADLQLWPGQFVNVRLLVDTLKQVVVAPTAGVQRGPNGTFIYVVNADDTVSVRPVTVGQQDDVQAVITAGVESGDRVVTTGFNQLTDGSKVSIGTATSTDRPPGSERQRARPSASAQPGAPAQAGRPGPPAEPGQPPRRDGQRRSERSGSASSAGTNAP
jgi:membrane fusion protein, multidrug efflux system